MKNDKYLTFGLIVVLLGFTATMIIGTGDTCWGFTLILVLLLILSIYDIHIF